MKKRYLSVALVMLGFGIAYTAPSQTEAGGGASNSSKVDSTFKRKWRPPAKHTAPKRIVARKTGTDYEAEGDRFYEQKDYDSALVAYGSAVKLKPTFHSLYRIGWIHNEFGEFSEALTSLDQAIALDSSQYAAYTEKGYAHRRLNQFDPAIAAFKRSIALKPTDYIAPYELGSIYNETKNYSEAERYLRQAIRNKSDYANAFEELGIVQRRQGRYDDAISSFNEAISLDSEDSGSYMGLGDVYFYGKKDYQKAIDAYLKGLNLDSDNYDAAYNVGYAYNDIGEYAEALPWLEKVLKLKPNHNEARAEVGFANMKLQHYPAAATVLRAAIAADRDYDTAHYYLGQVYVHTGNRTAATTEYRELQRLKSQYAEKLMKMIQDM
jgi:tetratricopeptide (TPR) repeat protein